MIRCNGCAEQTTQVKTNACRVCLKMMCTSCCSKAETALCQGCHHQNVMAKRDLSPVRHKEMYVYVLMKSSFQQVSESSGAEVTECVDVYDSFKKAQDGALEKKTDGEFKNFLGTPKSHNDSHWSTGLERLWIEDRPLK